MKVSKNSFPQLVSFVLIATMMSFMFLSFIPTSKAAGIGLIQNAHKTCAAYPCTLALGTTVTAGDELVVLATMAPYKPAVQLPNAPTDTSGDGFNLKAYVWCSNGGGVSSADCSGTAFYGAWVTVWVATSAGGSETFTFDSSYGPGALQISIFDLSGFSTTPFCTAVGDGASGTTGTTSTTCDVPASGVYIAMAGLAGHLVTANTYVATTGFTKQQDDVADASAPMNEYTVSPSSASFPTSFTVTWTTSAAWDMLGVVFQASAATGSTQTQTIGSCPAKNTGTFTMVNNTIYMYYGNALGSEVVNTVQTSVASITGSGSHTLKMLLYVSTGQSASVSTPLVLAYQQSIVISSGTTNNVITFQVNIPLNTAVANPLPFNLWGVGIVGDNKIILNQSSLSGLFTQTGSASTANQPASFTSQGSSVGTKLYLCASASYQSVLPVVTTTTTQAASTTSTVLTTSTQTVSTIGATLFTTSSNWPVIFLILLLPAGLFLGVTKTIAGAILGLVVGSVIGELMGILPTFVFVGLVISLIAVAFVARNREGG